MPRRASRPADSYAPGELVTLSWRLEAELKRWLVEQAESSGKPLSQEIAGRLRQSRDFDADFGGSRPAAFFRGLAATVAANFDGDEWLRDPIKFVEARELLVRHLHATTILEPDDWHGALVDVALQGFAATGNPLHLKAARELAEDPSFPAELRARALTAIAEVEAEPEAHRARRVTLRVFDDGRAMQIVPDAGEQPAARAKDNDGEP